LRFERVYNLALLYRVAHFYSFVTRRPLKVHLPAPDRVDMFHATTTLPIRLVGAPNVVTLHDVIPWAFREDRQRFRWAFRNLYLAAVASADMVFTVSEQSRSDAVEFLCIPQDRIKVTYQTASVPAQYLGIDQDRLAQRLRAGFDLEAGRYFVFFGAIQPRKNIVRMLEAMRLAKTNFPLVLVGNYHRDHGPEKQLIQQCLAERDEKVRYLPYQDEDALMHLVKGARAVLFPSLFEGFGLPVLESMQLGVPVITSNRGALQEVGGDAPLYVDPRNTTAIAHAIERLSGNDALCVELSRKGLARAGAFSPDRYLERLEEGYAMAIRNWKQLR
jgi:glycosyltransferase involved in cell wall biosynthesis